MITLDDLNTTEIGWLHISVLFDLVGHIGPTNIMLTHEDLELITQIQTFLGYGSIIRVSKFHQYQYRLTVPGSKAIGFLETVRYLSRTKKDQIEVVLSEFYISGKYSRSFSRARDVRKGWKPGSAFDIRHNKPDTSDSWSHIRDNL